MGDMNDVAGRDIAENRRFGIAPSLALGLGTPTRWTFSYFHQNADDNPDYGIPWLFNGPAPVNRDELLRLRERQLSAHLRRHRHGKGGARFHQQHHAARSGPLRQLRARRSDYGAADHFVRNSAAPTLATPLSQMIVNRHEIGVNSVETMLDEQLDLTAKFRQVPSPHLVTGVEGGKETSDPVRPTWTNVPTTSLFNPDPYQPFSGTQAITSIVHTTSFSAAAYVLDTMQLGKTWDLTGGIRWDRFDTGYTQQVAPASAFNRTRRHAELARGAGLQAAPDRQRLFRRGDFVQSVRRIALAERGNRESPAGEKPDL